MDLDKSYIFLRKENEEETAVWIIVLDVHGFIKASFPLNLVEKYLQVASTGMSFGITAKRSCTGADCNSETNG